MPSWHVQQLYLPCIYVCRVFGESCCPHFQGGRISSKEIHNTKPTRHKCAIKMLNSNLTTHHTGNIFTVNFPATIKSSNHNMKSN